MKALRIVKKFKNLTMAEERQMATALKTGAEAVDVLKAYLESVVVQIDKELTDVQTLYSGTGSVHLEVATLLATRSAHLKLLTLLTTEVVVLDDDPEEV